MKHRETGSPRWASRRVAWTLSLATTLGVVLAGVTLVGDQRVMDAASWLVAADLGEAPERRSRTITTSYQAPDGDSSSTGTGTADDADAEEAEAGDADEPSGSWPVLRTVLREEAREEVVAEKIEQRQRQVVKQRKIKKQRILVARQSTPFTFQVASFNVLGDSHTGPGGNKPGWPDAGPRMGMAIGALRSRSIDVVGFQEMEASQYHMFRNGAPEYATYPGLSAGPKSVRFNIAWRTAEWQFVEGRTLSVPYAGGSYIGMPVVRLESVSTGRRAWFANFHNPADTPRLGNNARWRAIGSDLEVSHLTALHQETGEPVIATGDYNDRAGIFCKFTGAGVFRAANGGSSGGTCLPPPAMQVDWIFGSSNVDFSGYAVSDVGRASDHAMINATATLQPLALPQE